ncbi:MAG: fibronectin type III domain-containing protein [Candidatus Omnitrophica bacterium]|nr:fibronectin type III domain-containing protein [Candidatus Omnitrophota bacterium]
MKADKTLFGSRLIQGRCQGRAWLSIPWNMAGFNRLEARLAVLAAFLLKAAVLWEPMATANGLADDLFTTTALARGAPEVFGFTEARTPALGEKENVGPEARLTGRPEVYPTVELQAPARPGQLTVTAKTATSVTLSWETAADSAGVVAYEVFCNGASAGSSTSNSFTSPGLIANRSYTFRVKARDASGNLSEASNAVLATPRSGVGQVQPVLVRTQFNALVLNYDPRIYVDGAYVRVADQYGYRDVDTLIEQYIRLLKCASGGQTVWSVAYRFDLDEFPPPADASRPAFNATNYVSLREQGYDYWNNPNPGGPAYETIIHDPRFGIADKINAGQIDAVWVFGVSGTGFWETAMAGPTAYYVNGGAIVDSSLQRNVVFYGFGKEGHQGVGFMCENTCHMAEVIMSSRIASSWPHSVSSRVFTTLNAENPARELVTKAIDDWTHFTQAEAASWDPVLVAPGQSQAGLSHFPPTAMCNYDWSTMSFDFNDAGPFHVYDGTWSAANQEYHALAGNGVKVLALDGMGMSDSTGNYHPPIAFSDGDVELTVRLTNGTPSSHAGFLFRVSACGAGVNQVKGYYVGLSASEGKVILAKLDHAYLSLTNATHTLPSDVPHRLRIESRGSLIRIYLDKSLAPIISYSDDSYVTGGFGLTTYSTEAFFSNLTIEAHAQNYGDDWYRYPDANGVPRDISPLEWNGDQGVAMDQFYVWWWEHLPKNGGGHYAADLQSGTMVLLLNTWWPYIFDINRFTRSCPFTDIVFPPEDVTPPTAPEAIEGLALGTSRIGLSWSEASDNVGVTRYAVYRNGVLLRKTALPYITDTRLSPSTSYTYLVKSADGSGNVSSNGAQVTVTTLATDRKGSILDGSFELNPQAAGWTSDAMLPSQAQFTWELSGTGRRGSRCLSIASSQFNDARWMQTVTDLTPGSTYWITGWIKGVNIVLEPGRSTGANLCLIGTWDHAPDFLSGTFDWRQATLPFTAPSSGTVSVGCRLGYWSSTTSGKAWFDDLMVVGPTELRLAQPEMSDTGRVRFILIATPSRSYRIERSPDLESWQELKTVSSSHPVIEISDLDSTAASSRYYRAVQTGTSRE